MQKRCRPSQLELRKGLTFVDASLDEIISAVKADSLWSPAAGFWQQVLYKKPSSDFKSLSNRTLTFWVKTYHNWQVLCKKRNTPLLTADDLKRIVPIGGPMVDKLLVMFDKDQGTRAHGGGRIDPREVMIAGVLISGLITTEHKFRYFFGLFDTGNRGALTLAQFKEFLQVYVQGLSVVFVVHKSLQPSPEGLQVFAEDLFNKISAKAGQRVKDMIQNNAHLKLAMLDMIRGRRAGVSDKAALEPPTPRTQRVMDIVKGNTGLKTGLMDMIREKNEDEIIPEETSVTYKVPIAPPGLKSRATSNQAVPYAELEEGCIGDEAAGNPVALPLLMSFKRWCSSRQDVFFDEFSDCDFNLATSDSQEKRSSMLAASKDVKPVIRATRAEVILSKIAIDDFNSTVDDIPKGKLARKPIQDHVEMCALSHNLSVSTEFVARLAVALAKVVDAAPRPFNEISAFTLWREVYPAAPPKLLRTFDLWCSEYAEWIEDSQHVEKALAMFKDNDLRPVIPAEERCTLKMWFDRLDTRKEGRIDADVFIQATDMSTSIQDPLFLKECQDGFIDEQTFLRLMCPPEYKLSHSDDSARSLFVQILDTHASAAKSGLDESLKNKGQMHRPGALLPLVSKVTWSEWEAVFDRFDQDRDELVSAQDLIAANALSQYEAQAFVEAIDPQDSERFSKLTFMKEMLKVNGFQLADPDGSYL